MNEEELKKAFVAFIEREKPARFGFGSWHDEHGERCEIVVAREAQYGAFDLILFQKFGGRTFETIPVEVKADTDKLDDRLRHQICSALLTFRQSILLLDEKQFEKAKKLHWIEVLPCEIWVRKGETFEQVTEEIGYAKTGEKHIHISQRAIEKAFGKIEPKELKHLQSKIYWMSSLLKKLECNQWSFGKEQKFHDEEAIIAIQLLGRKILDQYIEKPKPKGE